MLSEAWHAWPAEPGLPVAHPPGGRTVVPSAHCDDKVLGLGGSLADVADVAGDRDRDVAFCTAADGKASHPASPTYAPAELARVRAAELAHALTELGQAESRVTRFRLPDSGLASQHDRLTTCVAVAVEEADLVPASFRAAGHSDHDALGAAAVEVCADRVPVWEYPTWTWEWNDPRVADAGTDPWSCAAVLPVSAGGRRRRRAAVARFKSQVQALRAHDADRVLLEPTMLAHFERPFEVVFR